MSSKLSGRRSSRLGGGRSGRIGSILIAGAVAGMVSVPALAGPKGERVAAGSATFNQRGNLTTIRTSHRAIINYESFNIGVGEHVRFVQPNARSRVLNRIDGAAPTSINGKLSANGSVYFVNPAGVYFGSGAVINVGQIYAAAGNISDSDFLNGVDRFTDLDGEVVNEGVIRAKRAAHLIGARVANFGTVLSPNGLVTFTAGEDVLIGRRDGPRVRAGHRHAGGSGRPGDRERGPGGRGQGHRADGRGRPRGAGPLERLVHRRRRRADRRRRGQRGQRRGQGDGAEPRPAAHGRPDRPARRDDHARRRDDRRAG